MLQLNLKIIIMKDNLLQKHSFVKRVLMGIIFLVFLGQFSLMAQVQFSQTTDADFNKGVLNNVLVGSNNVSLQFAASDVGTWLTTTVLPQTLSGHKAATWNNQYVYVVGGWNDLTYSSAVYRATIQSGGISNWTTLASIPVALKDAAVVIGTNTIYVIGGRDASQVYSSIYYAAINTDGSIGAWQTSVVSLPAARWGHTAVYLNGFIYVAGGANILTETSAVNTVYYSKVLADNTLGSFTTGTALTAARNKHSMVTYNGVLYVLGGYADGGTKANTIYKATPGVNGANGAWTAQTNTLPVAISNHSSVVTNGLIMVLAGEHSGTVNNTVYYANADAGTWTWVTSPNLLYDQTKDGAAFAGNGIVYYSGGTNLSGTPIFNTRYANLTLTTNYVNHGVFTSNPFYELGAERLINSLAFTATFTAPANCQVGYRVAGNDKIWGDWTTLTSTSPITVNQTKKYLQYKVILTGSTTFNSTFSDMTLTTPGTQLSGNLNATTTFTQALSPYWATSDISFTAGTHTFQAGTTVLFLPGTGLTVSQANVVCSGTAVDSVKFMYFTTEKGLWDGIYFDPSSDIGVSSQFTYTVISGAGYGSNNANLYCSETNEPLLTRCNLRYADGNGLRLNSAHINLNNCLLRANMENGAYLNNSNTSFVSTTFSYNTGAGVYLTSSASEPTFSTSTISYNGYGMRYPSPNFTILPPNGSPAMTNNTHNGIAIDGGDITGSNKVWNSISYPYILLGTVRLLEYGSYVRLTIEPGNTIEALSGVQIQVGNNSHGGELYAIGTADSLITFTSHNGLVGGWNGIWFTTYSDDWGGVSVMDYCVIEKGNDYNILSESTVQPTINHGKIQNALLDGARNSSSTNTIQNTQFLNNGRYPYYFLNPDANPIHTGNTYSGNVINRIALTGGEYPWNRTLTNDNVPYYVLNDILLAKYGGQSRLTIDPGVIIEFEPGKKIQLGKNSYGGELWAEGTSGNPIIFRPYNGATGGWEGIFFTEFNDNWGGISSMKYCTIEKGNLYNIYCEGSSQPSFENCIIQNSLHDGLIEYNSSPMVKNCQFLNNGGYPINYTDWTCNSLLTGNTYAGNNPNYIALSGGTYSSNRLLYNDGIPYHVLGDIIIGLYGNHSRITLDPGVSLAFEPSTGIQLGYGSHGGELYAEGNADSIIVFKPYNNSAGGWDGIYFTEFNDNWGGTSSLKHCNIEKAASYNLLVEGSGQPYMEECILTQSSGNGLKLTNSSLTIRNCSFTYNGSYGIQLEGSSAPTIGNDPLYTCNLYNNTGYEVYNNTANNINARYNYWGTADSAMIASVIYDKYDNTAKGIVYFGNFAQVPSAPSATMTMTGWVKYANTGANPMKNASMVIKDFGGTTIASTTTNTSGVYAFGSFTSGNYTMTITPSNAWGGVNSTDALGILNHFAQISPLTGMKLAASDVNESSTVNGTDVLFVMKRYTGLITSFPSGDYLYNSDTIYTIGTQVTNNIKMICFGDVDASFAPTAKSTESLSLVYEGIQQVASFTEFDFLVKIKQPAQIGAISLGFYYPEEYLEINGAELANGSTNLVFNAEDGLFRMAWCDLSPLVVNAEETLVVLHMKAKDLSGLTGSILLTLFEDCELADPMAQAIAGVTISIPEIQYLATGIENSVATIAMKVAPNPFSGSTIVSFTLINQGKVRLDLYDMTGMLIRNLTETDLPAGNQQIELNAAGIRPGVYMLKAVLNSNGQEYTEIVKVVVSK
jgi:hypothetical protein